MDRISESLLNEFSAEHNIASLEESVRFEHFACYITVRRHYSEEFDTSEVVMGGGGDTSIDGIAVVVNGTLVADVDAFSEIAGKSGHLDVTFVFVQAKRSQGFDAASIGSFGFGVTDFFSPSPRLQRNAKIQDVAELMNAVYALSSKFKPRNPACRLYYVTTGKWVADDNLEARRQAVIADVDATQLFSSVTFEPIDSARLQTLYRQTKNAISREFLFTEKIVLPEVPGVTESYLGVLPVPEFIKLLRDDNDEIMGGLFYDNVRDWQDYNDVNEEIRSTLASGTRGRFVLMNNGITIIARSSAPTGNKFRIEDYTIVNGCQTSHVLFDQRNELDDSVMVPLRLISTQDEEIINAIIRSTNRQTAIKEEQFFATQEFSKELELFFQTFPEQHKLYYERRSNQYLRASIEKTRIVTPPNMVRAFAAMYLDEAHRTTRNYKAIEAKIGKEIFVKGQRLEPYYAAAFALYKVEYLVRSGKLDAKYRPARFHILMAARVLANPAPLPKMSSNEMERYCRVLIDLLSDSRAMEKLFARAVKVVDAAANEDFGRDNIRSEPFTRRVSVALANAEDEPAEDSEEAGDSNNL